MFEALAEGKLPLHLGVSLYPLPPRVGKIVGGSVNRVETLSKFIKNAGNDAIAAVAEAEFGCAGGELVKGNKLMKLHITIPGVSEMLAVVWLTQIVDATRFRNAQQVAAYYGFDPSLMVSAGKVTAHTRRRGHKLLHYSIKQAANLLIQKHSEPFGDWGWTMARVSKRGGWNRACGAVGRKMSIALWVCHRDQVAFNHDKYRFWRAPEVPDVDVVEVGLPTRQRNILVEDGIATTAPLTAAFYKGELADMEGVGPQCLVLIRRWINRFRDSSSTGR